MSSDFGYINARVRGMTSKLLGPEFFSQAVADSDFDAFLSTLSQTAYGRYLEEAQARRPGLAAVDLAIANNFRTTARSILDFSDGRPHELIRLFLLSYDLLNVESLIRAKHSGREGAEVQEVLLPAGDLKPALLEQLAAAPDVPAMAQILALADHPFASAFSQAARRYTGDGSLFNLELALDRAYYTTFRETLDDLNAPRAIVDYVARQIDATNLSTALEVRPFEGNVDELFIPGGQSLKPEVFRAIATSEGREALDRLAGGAFEDVRNAASLAEADQVIRRIQDQAGQRLSMGDPLGPGVAVDFLRRKEAETAKLRLLARGKYYDVHREQLERELGSA